MSQHDQHPPEEFDLSDEEMDQWLDEWDQAEREAVELLRDALREYRALPQPGDQLRDAAAEVRTRLREGGHPIDWVGQAAAIRTESAPDDDAELLIGLAAATISPREETGLDVDEESILMSLELADWLGAIVSTVRGGPGTDASPIALVDGIRNCPEVDSDNGIDLDEESHLEAAFWIVALPWHALGLIDRDQRLTPIGAWILPRALARAWGGSFD